MTALLLLATGVTFLVGVVAVVAGLSGVADLHGAVLVAGRMASSVSVLAVVTVVWLADGLHHAPRRPTSAPCRPAAERTDVTRPWRECPRLRYVVRSKSMQTHRNSSTTSQHQEAGTMQFGIFTVSDVTTDPTTGTTPDDTHASRTS